MKKILFLCLIFFFSFLLLFSCSGTQETDPDSYMDEGFITGDIFQTSVTGNPDKYAVGLVEQRKTAYVNAEYVLVKTAVYRIARHICSDDSITREKLNKTVQYLLDEEYDKKGYIYETYYTDKNKAVIVYRFKDKDLKKRISQIPCGGKN